MRHRKGTVEPIRDIKKIEEIKRRLIEEERYRDWLMIVLGLNFALRISDLLQLKIQDVYDCNMTPKFRLIIREKKTGKENVIAITPTVRGTLIKYSITTGIRYCDEYLFRSRQG
jgi:integrase